MKKILMIFAVCFTYAAAHANADTSISEKTKGGPDSVVRFNRPHIIKTNLAGPFSLYYEMQLKTRQSLQLNVNRASYGVLLGGDIKYFALTAAYKFYLSKKDSDLRRPGPAGFYLSPYVRYVNARDVTTGFIAIDEKRSEMAYNLFGAGGVAGYQLIFRKGFTLDFFAGAGYLPLATSKVVYQYPGYLARVKTDDYKLDVRIGVCVGFAFKK